MAQTIWVRKQWESLRELNIQVFFYIHTAPYVRGARLEGMGFHEVFLLILNIHHFPSQELFVKKLLIFFSSFMNNCFFYWIVVHVLNSHSLSKGKSQDKFQLGKVSCLFRVRLGKLPYSLSWSGYSLPFLDAFSLPQCEGKKGKKQSWFAFYHL